VIPNPPLQQILTDELDAIDVKGITGKANQALADAKNVIEDAQISVVSK
jgi:hypothetical protein